MNRSRFLLLAMLAGPWVSPAAPADQAKTNSAASAPALPAAVRPADVSDTVIVRLPGPAPAAVKPAPPASQPTAQPASQQSETPMVPSGNPSHAPATVMGPPSPKAIAAKSGTAIASKVPDLSGNLQATVPEDFRRDAGQFCLREIGRWKMSDVRKLLGEPLRERPALDEKNSVNGRIYAFSDPSGLNKELNLTLIKPPVSCARSFSIPSG